MRYNMIFAKFKLFKVVIEENETLDFFNFMNDFKNTELNKI